MDTYHYEDECEIIAREGLQFFRQTLYPHRTYMTPHIHSAVEILFVQGGHFQVYVDDVPYTVGPGDTVLLRSNVMHRAYPLEEADNTYYVLKLQPTLICDFAFPDQRSRYLLHFALNSPEKKSVWTAEESADTGIHASLQGLIRESAAKDYCYDIGTKIHVAGILLALLRSSNPSALADSSACNETVARRIYDTVLYINSHYAEPLTAEACGNQVFMSYSHFSRSFRKVTGKSFKEYLNSVRIYQAEKALLSGNLSISQIAADCGFNSVSYFISTYKRLRGTTPLAFRKTGQ